MVDKAIFSKPIFLQIVNRILPTVKGMYENIGIAQHHYFKDCVRSQASLRICSSDRGWFAQIPNNGLGLIRLSP